MAKETPKNKKPPKDFKPTRIDEPRDASEEATGFVSRVTSLFSSFNSLIRMSQNLEFKGSPRIRFNGLTTQYEIYREAGDNGSLVIDAVTDAGNEDIQIGKNKKPLTVKITGTDEADLKADSGTNNSELLIEPTKAGFFTNTTNTFKVRFPNLSSDPAVCVVGDITVVGGKLKICTSTNTWTIVGTQT